MFDEFIFWRFDPAKVWREQKIPFPGLLCFTWLRNITNDPFSFDMELLETKDVAQIDVPGCCCMAT